jgi:hypothetical protein
MPSRLEKEIEKAVCEYAHIFGILTPKIQVVGERGWPDRIFIDERGVHIWVEFKKEMELPTPIQVHRMQQLAERDTLAVVICEIQAGKELVDAMVAARIPVEGTEPPSSAGIGWFVPGSRSREN